MEYCEREKEVKEFAATKMGVKGLIDSGITKIPRIFIHPPEDHSESSLSDQNGTHFRVPLIDLQGLFGGKRRNEIVNAVKTAAETWGFFQIVNHGIPENVLEQLLESVRRFHEQPQEYKDEWYSRDFTRQVNYYSNGDLNPSNPADWRDTLSCKFKDDKHSFDALPHVCRREISEYFKGVIQLRDMLSEVLSEALGLRSDYLKGIGCLKSVPISCHYYPVCPEPDLTLGATKHSDCSFLTFVLQDNIGGLQVLHRDHWVDIAPVKGALVVNLGDFMQIISNDKFKSVEHRVLANRAVVPRVSVATFFGAVNNMELFGPIKELLSVENPPVYRETTFGEYMDYYRTKGQDGNSALPFLKIQK
ncbi:Oxoglutarate/iron-dependent dioxygenase [Trema orientale]|uniref:Oxoglutarate/iron-dependent dioxygenase n=1 Tax=Trema orientale TaxID=63057 RepID=A0A2P5FBB8_TREOI|nr:Oxoglutarate/iron-dependent dioxygenase [Trema orientale]